MANESLSVTIQPNGSLTITDLRTHQTYERLMTLEDCADIGDGWYHGQAVNDRVFVSTARSADVALLQDGPLLTRFSIGMELDVPERFMMEGMQRSGAMASLKVSAIVTLRAGADHVDVRMTVDNTANDHRLRVLFPTGADAQTYLADSPFDVVERPIALRADNGSYRELEVETKPQQSWTSVADQKRGLAIVAPGHLETAVRNLPERPLALTLFRATRRTVMTDGEPGGQLRESMSFAFRIVPLRGEPDRVRLGELGQDLAADIRAVQLVHADCAQTKANPLPPVGGLFRVTGKALLSSARMVDGMLEVRLFNPSDKQVPMSLSPAMKDSAWLTAEEVDFESRPLRPLPVVKGIVKTSIGPKKIVTLRLQIHGS